MVRVPEMDNKGRFLIVGSLDRFSGKTLFILSLAKILSNQGYKIGYFKPLGVKNYVLDTGNIVDEDTYVMKQMFDLKEPLDELSPFVFHYDFMNRVLVKDNVQNTQNMVINLANKIASNKDIVFIEGHGCIWTGESIGLSSLKLSKLLNAPLIILVNYDLLYTCDRILLIKRLIEKENINCLGIVIVGATRDEALLMNSLLMRIGNLGFKLLGILPSLRNILPLTIREIADATDSKVLVGQQWLDKEIENLLVGAMTPDSAMKYFKITPSKAVITGGDRTDIILAALKTDTTALILTGNIYPEEIVLSEAEKNKVSVLLCPYDTYTTVRKIESYRFTVRYMNMKRLSRLATELEKKIDLPSVLEELGLVS